MKLRIILLAIILALLTPACGGGGEWIEWQRERLPVEEIVP